MCTVDSYLNNEVSLEILIQVQILNCTGDNKCHVLGLV